MKERSALLAGLGVLLLALATLAALLFGPTSDQLDASRPDVGTDPGMGTTTTFGEVPPPAHGPTTFPLAPTTVPYRLAEPQDADPTTTFPGPPPTFYHPTTTTTPVPTTTPPAPTTTTTLNPVPDRPALPPVQSIASDCGSAIAIQSLQSIFLDPTFAPAPATVQAYMAALNADLSRYLAVAPPQLIPAYASLINVAAALTGQLEQVGWNPKDATVIATLHAIAAAQPPYQSVPADGAAIQLWESQHCH